MGKILRNIAKCKLCNDVIESKYTYDYNTCNCSSLSVDGGLDNIKRRYSQKDCYIEMSEFEE